MSRPYDVISEQLGALHSRILVISYILVLHVTPTFDQPYSSPQKLTPTLPDSHYTSAFLHSPIYCSISVAAIGTSLS